MTGTATLPDRRQDSTAPDRTLQQRRDALKKGNGIRSYRAAMKKRVKARHQSALAILLDPPEQVHTMKAFELLLCVPKHGCVKVNRLLNDCRISPTKTIGGLSDRQRRELVTTLGKSA